MACYQSFSWLDIALLDFGHTHHWPSSPSIFSVLFWILVMWSNILTWLSQLKCSMDLSNSDTSLINVFMNLPSIKKERDVCVKVSAVMYYIKDQWQWPITGQEQCSAVLSMSFFGMESLTKNNTWLGDQLELPTWTLSSFIWHTRTYEALLGSINFG